MGTPLVGSGATVSRVLALAAIALGLGGLGVAALTDQAFIDGYTADGSALVVSFAPPGQCDQMIRVRALESDDAVTLDLLGLGAPAFVPTNASQPICTARLELAAPLGGRELRVASGETVAAVWASVGR
ncbi:hypothetical protein [Demequina soli]|uniref:hypothetical protein n=1 Tax=Demequina soli TaxID=1638987 RepID=UPI000781917A|nr:hypothetical protein [Demequina soli]